MTDYKYDVFLSYPREKPSGTWVKDHFLPYFQHHLGNALNRKAKVFYDRTEIHFGQKWPECLKDALAHSRCLVGIWCPLYFQSLWCSAECAIMLHRESQLGLGTSQEPSGLIVGVQVNDGIWFPEFAKKIHYASFDRFYFDESGFAQTPLYVDFQREIARLADDVARVAEKAPPWSQTWLTAAYTDDVINNLQSPKVPTVAQPVIT